jgi:acetyl esterase/lipase
VAQAPFLEPFVLSVAEAPRRREGIVDVYSPARSDGEARPAVVLIHGGPLPPDLRPTPRDWPVYRGYGSLAASHGMVGITVDHRLHSPTAYPTAAHDVASAVTQARSLNDVDANRVALWFFSGGGLLSAEWLAETPEWLRCVALSYPLLAPLAGWDIDARFRPVETVSAVESLPILLTRVGRERAEIADTVKAFTASAKSHQVAIDVVDVPDGQHGFDMLDHTERSRAGVMEAMAWVSAALNR